ncbi:DUF1833 family protein [Breoghania sp.]|uniref:DUF1833 family protein n=1 Tax=Breoghania sp. TaxID=2065378 RepID=UPI002AABD267|nr:DUF1833 family protein [Breoghania sp.]
MSDEWSAAVEEAYASATSTVVLHTVELRHPGFVEDGNVIAIRLVADEADHAFLLEDAAPMDGGQTVNFLSLPFGFEPPSSAEGQVPQVKFWVDNASRQILPHLEEAVNIRAPIELTYREYIVGMDGPQTLVDGIELSRISVNGQRATATARLNDWQDRLFPARLYDIETFRTLTS